MKIPHDQLSEEVLLAVIEAFILREGTDYGEKEVSLDTKVNQVRRQLEAGEAFIAFDSETESVSILPVGSPSESEKAPEIEPASG